MAAIDAKGIRLAEDLRTAIERRELDRELNGAIRAFDEAVEGGTTEQLQDAASQLLVANTVAERRYREETKTAFVRAVAPELLADSPDPSGSA